MSDQQRPRSRFDSEVSASPSRSRFDRDESDRPSRSRFDRRSRSPSSREPEPRRPRSPVGRGATDSPASSSADKTSKLTGAAAAAAAVAARIAAGIAAKKGIQHVDVPPIRSVRWPHTPAFPATAANVTQAVSPPAVKSPNLNPGTAVAGETYQQDGDFIKDIEINDLRNRYTLTKGATQKKVTSFCIH